MSISIIPETPEAAVLDCRHCQHSVDVRGVTQIVCLAYLSVRPRVEATACVEFEAKRRASRAAVASAPVLEGVGRV